MIEENIIKAIAISVLMVLITSSIFYEILHATLKLIAKYNLRTRPLMLVLIISIFSAHTISVWLYGCLYWGGIHWLGFEALSGIDYNNFFGYIYFSAATYSSLGIGDVFPHGAVQFIAGVEVLNGLMLIGWSVMFSYFSVQKLWDLHDEKVSRKKNGNKS